MSSTPRKILRIIEPEAVVEGAGVRLKRSIGTRTLDYLDPFLLLDHFQSKNRADYEAGFPLHPHRGIETVTYLLTGAVRHKDTLGNAGVIGPSGASAAEPSYLDVSLPSGASFVHPIARGHSAFAYVFEGEARFGTNLVASPKLVVWGDGDSIEVSAEKNPARFLLVSGKP